MLLLDGDFFVYKAATTVKQLKTAITRFYTEVLTQMFCVGTKQAIVYITPDNCAKCFRYFYPTIKQYQANRPTRIMPLKSALKEHLINNPLQYEDRGITIEFSEWFEADDLIITDAYRFKENGIVSSGDKDMYLTPYPYFNNSLGRIETIDDPYGYIELDRTKCMPCVGRGWAFFFAQLLMGDTADNVKGITKINGKDVGAVGAYNILKDARSVTDALDIVLPLYAAINQNILAEAEMLWLRRHPTDSAYKFFLEHIQDNSIYKQWIIDLNNYHKNIIQGIKDGDSDNSQYFEDLC